MAPKNGPKNKGTNKAAEEEIDVSTTNKKESREEQENVTIDKDAQHYFDAQDEDQELNTDDIRDIPL
jgi:hypothetical protein